MLCKNVMETYPVSLLLNILEDDGTVGLIEDLGVETGNDHVLDIGTAVKPLKRHQLRQQLLVYLQQKENTVSNRCPCTSLNETGHDPRDPELGQPSDISTENVLRRQTRVMLTSLHHASINNR